MARGFGETDKAALLTPEEREKSVVISDPTRPDNPVVFISEEFEAQTGYDAMSSLGRNCRFLQGPNTDSDAIRAIRSALDQRSPITIDILNYRKDGSEFWNRLRIRPIFDESGNLAYFAGAQNPISADEARPGEIRGIIE